MRRLLMASDRPRRMIQVAYKAGVSGAERIQLYLVRWFVSRGWEVSVVVPSDGEMAEESRSLGARVVVVPFSHTMDLRASRAMAGLFDAWRPDLVHSHGLLCSMLVRWALALAPWSSLLHGRPLHVTTVHLPLFLGGGRPLGAPSPGWRRWYYRFIDVASFPLCDAFVAVSEGVAEDLRREGIPASRIRVILNGIDVNGIDVENRPAEADTRAARGDGRFDVLWVGRVSIQKNPRMLLDVALEARGRIPGVRFLAAGDGPMYGELEGWIEQEGAAQWLRLLGRRSDVPRLMAGADAFLSTSMWEGLPLVVLEAMAASLPVVATSCVGNAEAVSDGETGRLVPLHDATAAADALEELARDEGLRRRWGSAGRKRVETLFDERRMCREYELLFNGLLARDAGRSS